ncbi:O-antigen ligase family protein [Rubripirellula tenax]|nr:O-antigen ligase family protein [Rubripirellula tenax]
MPTLCFAVIGLATLFNTIDINASFESTEDHVGVDWPVMVKLAIAAIAGFVGASGLAFSARVRRSLLTLPGFVLIALSSVFVVTSAFAYDEVATVSRIAALINVAYLLFVPTALAALGLRRLLIACLIGMVANLLINWGLYLGVPQVGVFEEELGNQTFINRMGGLGHPNAIARIGVLTVLISMAMLRDDSRKNKRAVLIALIVLGIMTAISTFSRSAFVAGCAGAMFLMVDRLLTRGGVLLGLAMAAVIAVGVIGVELTSGGAFEGDSIALVVTKTGEVEELTSATGRTEIWAEAIRLIAERPLIGWGLNSAPKLMQNFSMHTHNLLLHATFSGGVMAGLLTVLLLGWNLFSGLSSTLAITRAISAYVLVSCIFEDTVLDTFASPSTLLWFVVLLYPAIILSSKGPGDDAQAVE